LRTSTYARKRFHREKILGALAEPGPREVVLVLDHLKVGFNVGKIFRTAQFFGAREVLLVGVPWFDPAPAKGAFRQTRSRFFDHFREAYEYLTEGGYECVALDPKAEQPLWSAPWPRKVAFVLGHEEYGLSFSPADFAGVHLAALPRVGRTESLNVSVAASLAIYEYVRRLEAPPSASKSL
jgi:tRNA G18 (ribose-2'-O)-methylase SpoU